MSYLIKNYFGIKALTVRPRVKWTLIFALVFIGAIAETFLITRVINSIPKSTALECVIYEEDTVEIWAFDTSYRQWFLKLSVSPVAGYRDSIPCPDQTFLSTSKPNAGEAGDAGAEPLRGEQDSSEPGGRRPSPLT